MNMSQIEKMRAFVSQRLNVAVEEILTAFAKTMMKYEQEAAQCHEVISRQHALLCALNRPVMDSPYADMFTKQLLLNKEAVPLDSQDQNPDQDMVPQPSQVGEVQHEEQHVEQLQDLDEAEIIEFTFNSKLATKPLQNRQLSAEPGLLRPHQDIPLVSSSETEDSSDYNNDSAEIRPTSDKPRELSKPQDRFSCMACNRIFRARRFLSRHVSTHLRDKEQVCGLCGERFEGGDGLALHLQAHQRKNKLQTEARTLNWEKRLQRRSNLQVQDQQKPNKCNNCGKALLKKRHRCLAQNKIKDMVNPEKNKKKRRRII